VLSFVPTALGEAVVPSVLARLVRMCFQKRRKQLGNTLKLFVDDAVVSLLESEGLNLRSRPEELSPEQFQALSLLMKPHFKP